MELRIGSFCSPVMTREELHLENIANLRAKADEARHLASTLDDPVSIAGLFKYAESLEVDAAFWELGLRRRSEAA
jgi:hypothetical protein